MRFKIKGKRILITGMAGSIGSELLKQLAPNNKIFGLDFNETGLFDLIEEYQQAKFWVHGRVGDIRDSKTVHDVFSDFKPQFVFHAAAYKHVTPMEWYPIEAIHANVLGTHNLIDEAKRWECLERFVFISTDKAVQSNSVMGATKRLCEIMVKNQGNGFVVVRFGNVLGSRGSVIPIWQKQMDEGKPLTITDERMERYFMTINEAVALVIKATEFRGGEIIVLDMGKPIKIIDLAKKIIEDTKKGELKFIGIRPGELLGEKIMFAEEEKVAVKQGDFWIIK